MKVFLDFEASSLSDRSYPIEVAWAFQGGRTESHLIRLAPDWTAANAGKQAHPTHRALADAEGEYETWCLLRQAARGLATQSCAV